MKKIVIFMSIWSFVICSISCRKNDFKRYIIKKRIDITKPHNIEAKYFIGAIRDTLLNDSCYINVHVLSRIGGTEVQKGTFFIHGSENRNIAFENESSFVVKIKSGYYSFNVKSSFEDPRPLMDATIDKILIRDNSYMEIYFLMGSLVQR
jgi:hypothetical protein